DFNIKSRWSFGANYELPFAKSRRGVTGMALAGWQVNGSFVWMTGLPFTVTDLTSVSGVIGLTSERPNLVGSNIRVPSPTVGSSGHFLDPGAFALPTASSAGSTAMGTAPRNIGYGPNQSVVNMSLFKAFRIRESMNLQFRAEGFNIPNHPVFGNPNVTF